LYKQIAHPYKEQRNCTILQGIKKWKNQFWYLRFWNYNGFSFFSTLTKLDIKFQDMFIYYIRNWKYCIMYKSTLSIYNICLRSHSCLIENDFYQFQFIVFILPCKALQLSLCIGIIFLWHCIATNFYTIIYSEVARNIPVSFAKC
jgi:hypothetical protein